MRVPRPGSGDLSPRRTRLKYAWLPAWLPAGPRRHGVGRRLECVNDTNSTQYAHDAAPATHELHGTAALRRWLDLQSLDYAQNVRWSAPRRGVAFAGRAEVLAYLQRELGAMTDPRMTWLRTADGAAQTFHEFVIRFRLAAPGIVGLAFPAGADVELERLRVLTYDDQRKIAAEVCIETWTWLRPPSTDGSPER